MLPADQTTPFILLDDSRAPDEAGHSLLFTNPEKLICARSIDEVPGALLEIDEAQARGRYVAGWIAYEASAAFEPKVRAAIRQWPEEPLVWMMVCGTCTPLDRAAVDQIIETRTHHAESDVWANGDGLTVDDYQAHVSAIKDYINAGDIYQANFTFPKRYQLAGDPLDLYRKLRREQPVEYGAFIQTGEQAVLSFSPELFVRRTGDQLMARPMKGTAARFPNIVEDREAAIALSADEKTRAENLMIVDLLRNDLSRLARRGSVRVSDLFTIETYPTVHQMTSGIEAECHPDLKPSDLVQALFPCGSVTGAPKIRAMEIIAEQETEARGIYCGAIGYFSPSGQGQPAAWSFNVPIRTMVFDGEGRGRFGVGSGVVADSIIQAEFDECQLKSQFIEAQCDTDFHLIETMRGESGSIELLEHHLDRMESSARSLGIPFSRAEAKTKAAEACRNLPVARVRLCLNHYREVEVTATLLEEENKDAGSLHVGIAAQTLQSDTPSLRYKSSQRSLYDLASQKAADLGLADILFFNEKDELVEGAISSVFVEIGGKLVTPPISTGALPGIMRRSILSTDVPSAEERSIFRSDLLNADKIFLSNAVRGLREVEIKMDGLDLGSFADS